jgi:hypothetical protein
LHPRLHFHFYPYPHPYSHSHSHPPSLRPISTHQQTYRTVQTAHPTHHRNEQPKIQHHPHQRQPRNQQHTSPSRPIPFHYASRGTAVSPTQAPNTPLHPPYRIDLGETYLAQDRKKQRGRLRYQPKPSRPGPAQTFSAWTCPRTSKRRSGTAFPPFNACSRC